MKLLIYVAELLLVLFFLKILLSNFFRGTKKQSSPHTAKGRAKRFDESGCDISDADYKEIR
ncbi:MAG: hypothetical protein ACM31E_00430 [Fibrobacterota bacterium]|nr:hypothetical protein [Chitinispirillaceae bacterium]